MWQRFTERSRRIILLAQEEAARLSSGHVGTEHILLGMTREHEGVAAQVLRSMGVTLEGVRREVEAEVQPDADSGSAEPKLTPKAKRVLELAADEARRMRHNYIGTEHLLLALLREKEGLAATVLRRLGLNLENARTQVMNYLGPDAPGVSTPQSPSTETHSEEQDQPSSTDWQRFTTGARIVILMAQEAAQKLGSGEVAPEHLLLGLLRHEEGVAAYVLRTLKAPLDEMRQRIEGQFPINNTSLAEEPLLNAQSQHILELATEESRMMKYNYIGTEHLLLALLLEPEGASAKVLKDNAINGASVLQTIIAYMNSR